MIIDLTNTRHKNFCTNPTSTVHYVHHYGHSKWFRKCNGWNSNDLSFIDQRFWNVKWLS